ncbi:MAG: mannosyl-glycoprotein endo-beta-N-acetylglucosamidase [Chitinophagaceae bacterium]|nr:mannosyl-glycoprotein endo-beta-N-acetylglucosamidase [Chitinophagaceae bacterium]
MKNTLFLFLAILSTLAVRAQSPAVKEYIAKYKEIAMDEMMRSGVPAAITLAQGLLESQAGQSDLVKQSNNHFGIKCKENWTGNKVYHDDDARGECFRGYLSAEESFRDHSDFLKTRSPYAFLFKLDPTDYEGWAKGLKKAGYATNPAYAQVLIKTIVENNLQEYSLTALSRMNKNDDALAKNEEPTPGGNSAATQTTAPLKKDEAPRFFETKNAGEPAAPVPNNTSAADVKNTILKTGTKYYPPGIFNINGCKVVYATAGTSLLSLANLHEVSYQKLIDFNDMDEQDILQKDQLIYLEKKSKRGATDFHVVSNNETLYDIAQKEGIRMESILSYNRIPKGMEAARGEMIYLRSNSPVTPKLSTQTVRN